MKRLIKLITIITLTAILATSAAPLTALARVERIYADAELLRFIDTVGLLPETQAIELILRLSEISNRQNFDVVVAVTNTMSTANPELYAADFYEQHGFGFGENLDGIILMIALEPERMFAIATTGYGQYAFTSAGIIFLEDLFLPYLRDDRFFDAFVAYADAVDDFVTRARAGERYDTRNIPLTPHQRTNARIWSAVASVALAAIIAGAVVAYWSGKLKSVKKRDFACDYVRRGSFALTLQRDIFLYRNISRIRRSQNNNSGGGRGGSFSSSSGRSFSGSSGRF